MAIKILVQRGDITKLQVDAIVNAANELMLGGGGVDGAIHSAAGDELLEACLAVPEIRPGVRCPTGTCQLTPGFQLPAKFIIHTVGPVWRGGGNGEADLLRSCYRESMKSAVDHEFNSVAFPAISCGVYRFPLDQAAEIAVNTIRDIETERGMLVYLVAFDEATYRALEIAAGL